MKLVAKAAFSSKLWLINIKENLIQTHARKERLLFLPITRFMAEAPIIKHK
jgi:hypothetical protein